MPPAAGMWTERRTELRRALGRVDESLGDLYQRAVDTLSEKPLGPTAIVVAAHCIREIANTLPDVLEDVDEVPSYSDVSGPAQALTAEWRSNADVIGDPNTPITPATSGRPHETAVVSVPARLLEATRRVVIASANGSANARLRASAVVLGRLEAQRDPSVEAFRRSTRFFTDRAHLNRSRQLRYTEEEVMEHLRVIEVALLARVGDFFKTAEELMDVLLVANRRIEEKAP